MQRRHLRATGLIALSVWAGAARAQQTAPSEPPVVSGPATTIPSQNAPIGVSVVTQPESASFAPGLETLLDGKVPGATIESSTSDAPGEGLQIQMRGVTSLNATDVPLYVVDGIFTIDQPMVDTFGAIQFVEGDGINRISDIAPSDIASIEVLKGAAATAIYGGKAAAGAVIITTKRGAPGRMVHWEVDGEVGHTALANELPMRAFPSLQSAQAWYVTDVTHDTTAAAISNDRAYIRSLYAGPQNYQTQLFGNAQLSDLARVSVDGTIAGTQYYLSALSTYDNGVVLHAGDLKQSLRGNVTEHVGSVLAVSANLAYIDDDTHLGAFAAGAAQNPYQVMSFTPGFLNLERPSASGAWPVNPFGSNPFADLESSGRRLRRHELRRCGEVVDGDRRSG